MKNLVLVIIVSVLSAAISVSVYKYFEKPQSIIIREQVPVRYTNFSEDQSTQSSPRTFLSASPTNFTKAAEVVTPAVVNIKATSSAEMDWWSNGYGGSSGSGVIISPDEMNMHLRTIVISPLTTSSKKYPTRIEIKHDNKIGCIVIDQIRTIDKQRIIKVLGRLSKPEIKEVKAVLKETFVD